MLGSIFDFEVKMWIFNRVRLSLDKSLSRHPKSSRNCVRRGHGDPSYLKFRCPRPFYPRLHASEMMVLVIVLVLVLVPVPVPVPVPARV